MVITGKKALIFMQYNIREMLRLIKKLLRVHQEFFMEWRRGVVRFARCMTREIVRGLYNIDKAGDGEAFAV